MDETEETWYVAFVMKANDVRIVLANESHLETLSQLIQSVGAESDPEGELAALAALEGLRNSLSRFDIIQSDSHWIILAFADGQPVGLAVLVRVPKLDGRLGFLYVDELHVLKHHRRQGVAKAMLTRCIKLAQELELAGVRLLARIDNEPARRLYESMGFQGSETTFYELRVAPKDPQP